MSGKQYIGKNWICLEGDTLFCKYSGVITLADVKESSRLLEQLFLPGQTYYIITDVSGVTGMEAEARRASTEWFTRHDIGGAVNFGAGTAIRAIAALILGLLRRLHRSTLNAHFVQTEAEARAWVQEQRQLRAKAPAAGSQ